MTVFIGNALNNFAISSGAGTLVGFVGGTIAQLQDAVGDTIVGLAGNDRIIAGNGNDVILGGDGNDFIDGRFGFDVMDGGSGIDTMDVSFFAGAYVWNMDTGITNFSAAGEFAFDFENAITGSGNDNITGSSDNNVITTNAGNDSVAAGGGNDTVNGGLGLDTLRGEAGNDRLSGGLSNDALAGGVGFDTFVFNTAPNSITNADRIADFISAFDTISLENAVYAALPAGALAAAAFRVAPGGTRCD